MDAMMKLVAQALRKIRKMATFKEKYARDNISEFVEDIELRSDLDKNESYWAGYLRGVAESENRTIIEMIEDIES